MGHYTSGKHFKLGDIVHAVLKPTSCSSKTASGYKDATQVLDDASTDCEDDASMVGTAAGAASSDETLSTDEIPSTDDETLSTDEIPITDKDFIDALGLVLERWVEEAATADKSEKVSHFHSTRAPGISIDEYLKRIQKYFVCSDECFVIALVYIDRISKMKSSIPVCKLTVHRLLLISVMVAAKFHDDVYYSNKYYSKVGGISLKEVNALEAVFLKMMDWNVCVSGQEYKLYHRLVNESVNQPHERLTL